jgi:hypothetical protein
MELSSSNVIARWFKKPVSLSSNFRHNIGLPSGCESMRQRSRTAIARPLHHFYLRHRFRNGIPRYPERWFPSRPRPWLSRRWPKLPWGILACLRNLDPTCKLMMHIVTILLRVPSNSHIIDKRDDVPQRLPGPRCSISGLWGVPGQTLPYPEDLKSPRQTPLGFRLHLGHASANSSAQ